MDPNEVRKIIGDIPWMTLEQGKRMTNFIRQNRSRNILELGFCHGVSTCYMAAAIEAESGSSITTIDGEWARKFAPNIEQLLEKIGLRDKVFCYYEPTSYTWRLMKLLDEDPTPRFDFCYIDGAHNWFDDGFAFFLVDRLLKPNGWIIFDDLDWTYGKNLKHNEEAWKAMPLEEREVPQVRKVYELLVKTHPSYGDFRTENGWGYAHKITGTVAELAPLRQEIIVQKTHPMSRAKVVRRIESGIKRLTRLFSP